MVQKQVMELMKIQGLKIYLKYIIQGQEDRK